MKIHIVGTATAGNMPIGDLYALGPYRRGESVPGETLDDRGLSDLASPRKNQLGFIQGTRDADFRSKIIIQDVRRLSAVRRVAGVAQDFPGNIKTRIAFEPQFRKVGQFTQIQRQRGHCIVGKVQLPHPLQ